MISTKYIVFESDVGLEMVIFGSTFQHVDFAEMMQVTNRIVSAGFLSVGTRQNGFTTVEAYGKSISLNVESNEEIDTKLAKQVLDL